MKPYPPPNCTLFVNMLVNGKRRENRDLLGLKGRDGGAWRLRAWLCVRVCANVFIQRCVWMDATVCMTAIELVRVLQTSVFLPPAAETPVGTIASLLFTVLPL